MFFINFSIGMQYLFYGIYYEIVENCLLCYIDEFDVFELVGKIEVCVEFKEVFVGIEVYIMQFGLFDVIFVDGCYLGW